MAEEAYRPRPEELERLKQLRLMDDDFMNQCFKDAPECVELVLRIVLDMPELTVVESRVQEKTPNLGNRSLVLDILALDSAGRWINVEIQRSDRGAARRRARFHSSMLDAGLLDRGDDFEKLPDTYVVFITERDVLGRGEAVYRFERRDGKTGESFGDGSHILYVNGAYRDQSPIGRLMHDFSCTDPGKMYYDQLAERAKYYKEGEGSPSMCKLIEDLCLQRQAEGKKEERRDMIWKLLNIGKVSPEDIAKSLGLSTEEVLRLAEEGQ